MSLETRQNLWNPEQYARFRGQRSQPFFDLLGLVERRPAMRMADLGCGPGELTRALHDLFADSAHQTIGVDSSEAMLAKTGAYAGRGVSFELADLREFAERAESRGAFDLVVSNAALQWVPDQPRVITSLTAMLKSDGQLALQVPANEDHPSHATVRELVMESPFREALGGFVQVFSNLAPEGYAVLLDRLGYRRQHVRLQVYAHHLPSRIEVVEWLKGSFLTDYQRRLPPALWERFLERYRELLLPRLEDNQPFLYTFKRILVWGSLSDDPPESVPHEGKP
jgi:trans-aconitate 2-methyltransferase